MARRNNLSNISSREELDRALDQLDSDLNNTSGRISYEYGHAKDFYTVSNLFNHFVDGISPAFNIAGAAIDLYDRIAARVNSARKGSAQRPYNYSDNMEKSSYDGIINDGGAVNEAAGDKTAPGKTADGSKTAAEAEVADGAKAD